MNLRMRLFIWVGALFIGVFTISYFLEAQVAKTNLLRAEENIKKEIIKLNELKREYIQSFLRHTLAAQEAKINVLLDKVAENQLLINGFRPSPKNLENQTWLNSALLSVVNKWVDFVQNTNESALGSLIAIDASHVNVALRFPVNKNLALIVIQKKGKWQGPFMGVNMQFDQYLLHEAISGLKEAVPSRYRYALFPIDHLMKLQISQADIDEIEKQLGTSLSFPFLTTKVEAQSYVKEFATNLQSAQGYLRTHMQDLPPPSEPEALQGWVKSHLLAEGVNQVPTQRSLEVDREKSLYGKAINREISQGMQELLNRYDEIDMVWGISTLLATGMLGHSPFDPQAPIGTARFVNTDSAGKSIYNVDVFGKTPLFDFQECTKDLFPEKNDICLGSKMEVIDVPQAGRTFFSNSMRLKSPSPGGMRTGYLTAGIDASRVLRQLSLATHEATVLVSGGRVVSVYDADGNSLDQAAWRQMPIENMINESTGLTKIGGEEYFFLHMTPFPEMDFHFFIFNPKAAEFALLDTLDSNAKQLIDRISFQMRCAAFAGLVVVLVCLNNIARKMTQPISKLAHATEMVGKGKLENVHLPELKTNRQDEICTLYRTFSEMVEELKDKEKVRGVLNKVVSREIAEEILKGNIHLGGEERSVTVLFADVRQFTHLTEKMPPSEVIELLNTCMTKISHSIDEYGGVIDKFVGDEVMALFGAPVAREDSALKAIQSALAMVETLKEWNEERKSSGQSPIEMGFGIHTGLVVAGNMGAENRLNYTVLGANVNLSSRLCSMASPMQVLITDETLKSPGVAAAVDVKELPEMQFKGFSEKMTVYEVTRQKSSRGGQ